jgi:hypothetical protein
MAFMNVKGANLPVEEVKPRKGHGSLCSNTHRHEPKWSKSYILERRTRVMQTGTEIQ